MRFILKHKLELILFALIIILYFLIRLPNLTSQPIFADEAIYIRWAQLMRAEVGLRFISMTDGKTPLFMWVMIPFLKIFSDPLLSGRILSVCAGLATLVGVFLLSWRVFNKRTALIAALFYAVVPYTVFFDRMALVDSMLAAFSVWSLYLAVWLLQARRLDLAFILGYTIGGGLLTKTPGIVNLAALPLTLVGFDFKKNSKTALLKLVGLWGVAAATAFMIYNILRLGPQFNMLGSRDSDYIFSVKEILSHPLDPFIPHVRDLADWFPKLLTWPVLLLIFIGVALALWQRKRLAWVIILWLLVPLLSQMLFLKTFTSRYLLLTIPPILVLAGFGLGELLGKFSSKGRPAFGWKIRKNVLVAAVALLLILPALYFDFWLLKDIQKAPLPAEERKGYLQEWTAGYGFKDIAAFLTQQSKKGTVVVGTEGSFGTLPDGLQIYLDKNPRVIIKGGKASVSADIRETAKEHPTYFVANKSRFLGAQGLELIKTYPKAAGKDFTDAILLFKVNP